MRIHVVGLNQGWVRVELASLREYLAATYRAHPLSMEYSGLGVERRPIASNRNRIVRDCPPEADVLVMIDSDCIPPADFLDVAELDLDIVGLPMPIWRAGELCTGIVPLDGQRMIPVGTPEVMEVKRVAGGVLFLARRVFAHPALRGGFTDRFDEDGVLTHTEDHVYCDRARALGFHVYAALGYPLRHVKEVDLNQIHDARQRHTDMAAEAG